MKITFQDIVNDYLELEVAVELNSLIYYSNHDLGKKDPVAEFMAKLIHSEHMKGNCVSVSMLSNTLHESENTIRTKIKKLIQHNLITNNTCCKDSRLRCYQPTEKLRNIYKVDIVRKLKAIEDISPFMKALFGDAWERLYKEENVDDYLGYPSYLKTTTNMTYNKMIIDIEAKKKNTLKKLG